VTLEVSKLSGWLKAVADCRVQKRSIQHRKARGTEMWHTEGTANQQFTQRACGPARECGRRRRWKRTWNMLFMSLTPEVSQLEMSALK
jgi:hypothetical protein